MNDMQWQDNIRQMDERERKARRILGVSDSAGIEEIKRAWRKEAHNSHPDKKENSSASQQQFLLIQAAYRFLTKGVGGEELDYAVSRETEPYEGKYQMDNEWGCFLWWREQFFE